MKITREDCLLRDTPPLSNYIDAWWALAWENWQPDVPREFEKYYIGDWPKEEEGEPRT